MSVYLDDFLRGEVDLRAIVVLNRAFQRQFDVHRQALQQQPDLIVVTLVEVT